jgi:hypothetical protein
MSRIFSKRRLLLGVVTSLVAVVAAMAFYSTVGGGEGSGTTADGYASDLDITGDVTAADAGKLVPGSSVDIEGAIANANSGAAKVSNLTGTVDPVPEGCDASWFDIVVDPLASDIVPAQTGPTPGSVGFTATLSMADAYTDAEPPVAINQDACKGATLDIAWASDLGVPAE